MFVELACVIFTKLGTSWLNMGVSDFLVNVCVYVFLEYSKMIFLKFLAASAVDLTNLLNLKSVNSYVECSRVGGGCLRFFRSKQVSNSVCTIKWFLNLIITKRLYHNSSLNSNPYSIRQRA